MENYSIDWMTLDQTQNSKYNVILVFDWEWNSYSFIKNLNEDLFNFVTYMSNWHAKMID